MAMLSTTFSGQVSRNPPSRSLPTPSTAYGQPAPKKPKACLQCHVRKVKCDASIAGLPCSRCAASSRSGDCILTESQRGYVNGFPVRITQEVGVTEISVEESGNAHSSTIPSTRRVHLEHPSISQFHSKVVSELRYDTFVSHQKVCSG